MKKSGKNFGKVKMKEAWNNVMHSTQDKISRGASQVLRIITWARGDNWRRKQKARQQSHLKKD